MKQGMINMIDRLLQKLSGRTRSVTVSFALLALSTIGAAQQTPQPTFSSAGEATQSLFQAVQRNNEETIANILGASTDLTSSRDPGQDKVDRELFVQKYQEMHRLCRQIDGSVTLYIGAENWPFPLQLVNKKGLGVLTRMPAQRKSCSGESAKTNSRRLRCVTISSPPQSTLG